MQQKKRTSRKQQKKDRYLMATALNSVRNATGTVFCRRCKKEEPFDPARHVMQVSGRKGKLRKFYKCNPNPVTETTEEWRKRLFG